MHTILPQWCLLTALLLFNVILTYIVCSFVLSTSLLIRVYEFIIA